MGRSDLLRLAVPRWLALALKISTLPWGRQACTDSGDKLSFCLILDPELLSCPSPLKGVMNSISVGPFAKSMSTRAKITVSPCALSQCQSWLRHPTCEVTTSTLATWVNPNTLHTDCHMGIVLAPTLPPACSARRVCSEPSRHPLNPQLGPSWQGQFLEVSSKTTMTGWDSSWC